MISAVELELAVEHLEAHGHVTDLVVPSLAHPGRHRRFLEALARRRGRRVCRIASALTPRHGLVWAIFDGPPRERRVEVAAIRFAIEEGAMAPVWTRTGA